MSSRRSRARGRARSGRNFPQDCYERNAGSLDNRPAFDATPFDSSSGGSAWDTLPTESIFDSTDCDSREAPSPDISDWLSSPEHRELMSFMTSTPNLMPCDEEIALAPRVATASGFGRTASPLLRRVLDRSKISGINRLDSTTASSSLSSVGPLDSCSPFSSGLDSIMSSGLDSSGLPPGSSGLSRFADSSNSAGSRYSQFCDDSRNYNEYEPKDITSPTPWNPNFSSQRLDDPNNPPPMFHPMTNNEWRTDPNISEEIRNMYASSCSEYSGNQGIFNYGRLSEYNTHNVYNPEGFDGLNQQADCTPTYEEGDCSDVFGDPHEALSRPTDEVPDKYRKEKWHYFELKKRLELFKQLGMEGDLAMYEGQLERMEADPWTGDDSGRDVQVYVRGMEGDPALDDELLEQMEALVAPDNEGLRAFYAAMENPPLPYDRDLELAEALVAPENESRRAFYAAMENPPQWNEEDSYLIDGSFQTCIQGDDTQLERLTSYTDEGRRAFERAMENPPPPIRDEYPDLVDEDLERMEQLVSPMNEQLRAFHAAMRNPLSNATQNFNDSFQTCYGGDDLEALVSPRNKSRGVFFEAMMANASSCGMERSFLDGTFQTCYDGNDSQTADSNLNTSFSLEEPSQDFPPDIGPDGC